ncbi:MAG: tRNA (adenosine(37)-N6)-dimethylallyltransferase MiaA [Planctomycetota bacterium]|nr:tRNA (adenosine(37)-N6)-dimethylallyltransferase MiaA [Planctomycetota bacterium]
MDAAAVPCLVGPTGSGKSDVGVEAARQTHGQVICCDAYTVYRGMPVLTAAPTPPSDVRHRLLGILDLYDTYDAGRFLVDCDHAVGEIRAHAGTPWIVGGTALYLRCWLKGFGSPVPRDDAFRAELKARVDAEGAHVLHAELKARDPHRAEELHPHDLRRVVRALEIIRATGKRASLQRLEWAGPDRVRARVLGLRRSWADLDARIEARTQLMFEAGVVEEAREVLASKPPPSPQARKVLGLAELKQVLAGTLTEAEAKARIAQRTRRYARKQMTFFRGFEALTWIDVAPDADAAAVAAEVLARYAETGTSS